MNCKQCGKALNQTRFCMYCGADQTALAQVPEAQFVPPQYPQNTSASNANLSMVGIILAGVSFPLHLLWSGLFFSIPAIVLGVLAKKNGEKNANIAIILGSVSTGLPVLGFFLLIFFASI